MLACLAALVGWRLPADEAWRGYYDMAIYRNFPLRVTAVSDFVITAL
jgi:hypothetical protein